MVPVPVQRVAVSALAILIVMVVVANDKQNYDFFIKFIKFVASDTQHED
jgi:hypothetical protein